MAALCENLGVNEAGRLTFAGQDTAELAKQYATPLYLLDEDRIRKNCRAYTEAFRAYFPAGSRVLYAAKANAFAEIFRIVQQEGLGADVVSCGEIYTAKKAGFDLSNAYFHSNNKTDEDIRFAMENGVGCFVAESEEEILAIAQAAAARGIRQKVMLRVTPGIDPHTYEAISTGKVDSKFGVAIETGQADAVTALALAQQPLELVGFHCHVGSQVFDEDVFERTAVVMLEFLASVRDHYGYTAKELNLGGGYGVRYLPDDPSYSLSEKLQQLSAVIGKTCEKLAYPQPAILMEPGRSIVADAGLTLYTVGTVKRIPGYKNYVSVDGGMTDNPRFALYGAIHEVVSASDALAPRTFRCDVVGRCCESGDVIRTDVLLPETVQRGDLLAACTTGAYNYSMASNYNRVPRPPIVMLSGGKSRVAVRRETLEDLVQYDL